MKLPTRMELSNRIDSMEEKLDRILAALPSAAPKKKKKKKTAKKKRVSIESPHNGQQVGCHGEVINGCGASHSGGCGRTSGC